MRKEHKPLFILNMTQWWNALYVKKVLRPQFDSLGNMPFFLKPRSIKLTGENINAGHHLHIISDNNKPVCLTTWSSKQQQGNISIDR